MKSSLVVLAVALALCLSTSESAAKKLIDLIPGLYGGDGITLGTNPNAEPSGPLCVRYCRHD